MAICLSQKATTLAQSPKSLHSLLHAFLPCFELCDNSVGKRGKDSERAIQDQARRHTADAVIAAPMLLEEFKRIWYAIHKQSCPVGILCTHLKLQSRRSMWFFVEVIATHPRNTAAGDSFRRVNNKGDLERYQTWDRRQPIHLVARVS
jgi:hypothetical protein